MTKTDLPKIGEGNYRSGKAYQDAQHDFVRHGPVTEKAREAADALGGPQGAELERARRESSKGKPA